MDASRVADRPVASGANESAVRSQSRTAHAWWGSVLAAAGGAFTITVRTGLRGRDRRAVEGAE